MINQIKHVKAMFCFFSFTLTIINNFNIVAPFFNVWTKFEI